jgi:hypothetical protein
MSVGEGVVNPSNVQFAQNESLDRESQEKALASIPANVLNTRLETNTPAGAALLEKHLHPPSQTPAAYSGITDRNTEGGLDYEWRLQDELNYEDWNAALSGATAVVIFSPPSNYRLRMVFATDGTNIAQVVSNNTPNPDLSVSSFQQNVERWRMCYLSDTYEQDANALNNAGMLYGCQFAPPVSMFAGNSVQSLTEQLQRYSKHSGFKDALKMIGKHFPAETLTSKNMDQSVMVEKLAATPALAVQVVNLGQIPVRGSEVLMKSPRSASWRSTIGAYFRHRWTEPVQNFISTSRPYTALTGGGASIIGNNAITVCFYETYNSTTDTWTLTSFQSSDGSTAMWDCTKWYEMTWSCILYDFSSQVTGGSGFSPASLVHKKIWGIETVPPFGSMNLALKRDCPVLDQRALDAIAMANQQCPDMMPAAANAFGGAMAAIAKYAPMVLSTLSSVFAAARDTSKNRETKFNGRVDKLENFLERMVPVIKAAGASVKQNQSPQPKAKNKPKAQKKKTQ